MDSKHLTEEEVLALSKSEKIKLVSQAYQEVCTELGPNIAPFLTKRKLCEMVQKKLPSRPLYRVASIESIVWGTYGADLD